MAASALGSNPELRWETRWRSGRSLVQCPRYARAVHGAPAASPLTGHADGSPEADRFPGVHHEAGSVSAVGQLSFAGWLLAGDMHNR